MASNPLFSRPLPPPARGPISPTEQLRNKLHNALVKSPLTQHHKFIPHDVVDSIITPEAISNEIKCRHPDFTAKEFQDWSMFILENSKKLFAILALFGRGSDICYFSQDSIFDKNLPLEKSGARISAFKSWTTADIGEFYDRQWWMISPTFELSQHYDLEDSTILPFVSVGEDQGFVGRNSRGGYSIVYMVGIHPAHHKFSNTTYPEVHRPAVIW